MPARSGIFFSSWSGRLQGRANGCRQCACLSARPQGAGTDIFCRILVTKNVSDILGLFRCRYCCNPLFLCVLGAFCPPQLPRKEYMPARFTEARTKVTKYSLAATAGNFGGPDNRRHRCGAAGAHHALRSERSWRDFCRRIAEALWICALCRACCCAILITGSGFFGSC